MDHPTERPISWVGLRQAPRLSGVLRDAFSPRSHVARLRFAIKLVAGPHLTDAAGLGVIGVIPEPSCRSALHRVVPACAWLARSSGQPFDRAHPPRALRRSTTWRVVNLASAGPGSPMVLVRLSRTLIGLADDLGVTLRMEAAPDDRLVRAYARVGFAPDPSGRPNEYERRGPRPWPPP